MVSGQELVDFANQHGFLIHPHRDPDDWAERINNNGGKCLCVPTRTCPCEESIDEINNAKDPKRTACSCTLYCNETYLKEWGYYKEPAKTKKSKSVSTQKRESQVAPTTIKTPEIAKIIKTIQTAKTEIGKKDFDGAYNTLKDESEQNACDLCKEILGVEALRATFVREACDVSPRACEEEIVRMKTRLAEVEDLYRKTDVAIQTGEPQPEVPIKKEPKAKKEDKEQDAYHACLSSTLKDPNVQKYQRNIRFWSTLRVCRGVAKSFEEAIEQCKKEHPEWF